MPKLEKLGAVNVEAAVLVHKILKGEERLDERRENMVCTWERKWDEPLLTFEERELMLTLLRWLVWTVLSITHHIVDGLMHGQKEEVHNCRRCYGWQGTRCTCTCARTRLLWPNCAAALEPLTLPAPRARRCSCPAGSPVACQTLRSSCKGPKPILPFAGLKLALWGQDAKESSLAPLQMSPMSSHQSGKHAGRQEAAHPRSNPHALRLGMQRRQACR